MGLAVAWIVVTASSAAFGQDDDAEPHPDAHADTAAEQSHPAATTSFGDQTSVESQLNPENTNPITPQYRVPSLSDLLPPLGDLHEELDERFHIKLSLDYILVALGVTDSFGDSGATGALLRFFGTWGLLDPGGEFPGSFVFKIEVRDAYTFVAPQNLGAQAGARGITAVTYSDAGFIVTNIYWQQRLFGDVVAFRLGQVDISDVFDFSAALNPFTSFLSYSMLYASAVVPGQGLGFELVLRPFQHAYVLATAGDANGDPSNLGMSAWEVFESIEIGYRGDGVLETYDNIHVGIWHQDARVAAGRPEGWGIRASAAWLFENRWHPFIRAGWSDGGLALAKADLEVGLVVQTDEGDAVGVGLDIADIPGALEPQYTGEAYYRFQLSRSVAFTLDLQVIGNPADNPNESAVVIGGARMRLFI